MNDPQKEFKVRSVGDRPPSRFLPIATFVVGIFLGVALIKPWDLFLAPVGRPDSVGSGPVAVATSTPTPSPTAEVPSECAFAAAWRVFAVGLPDPLGGDGTAGSPSATLRPAPTMDIGNPLRRWLEIVPSTAADGPDDPSIPFVTIFSERISGIGYCPPPDDVDGPPAGAILDAWRRSDDGRESPAGPVALRAAVFDPTVTIEVPVYVPSDRSATADDTWAAGRYVFAVVGSGYQRWFGVEIRVASSPPAG